MGWPKSELNGGGLHPLDEHLPRMTFHSSRAAHAASKMSFSSAASTPSADTLSLVATSTARLAASDALATVNSRDQPLDGHRLRRHDAEKTAPQVLRRVVAAVASTIAIGIIGASVLLGVAEVATAKAVAVYTHAESEEAWRAVATELAITIDTAIASCYTPVRTRVHVRSTTVTGHVAGTICIAEAPIVRTTAGASRG